VNGKGRTSRRDAVAQMASELGGSGEVERLVKSSA
jgi:hypothetical protein